MRKLIIAASLLALIAAVPAFAAGHGNGNGNGTRHHHLKGNGLRAGVKPARIACSTEQAADPAAFNTKYANKKGRHAQHRCIVRHVRQARKTCRTERQNDPAAFKTKYASEKGRHAPRRCVRQHSADPVS